MGEMVTSKPTPIIKKHSFEINGNIGNFLLLNIFEQIKVIKTWPLVFI